VGSYRLFIKPTAVKEIESILRKKDRQRVVLRIEQLADEPRPPGCQKLSGHDRYRVRSGAYRVVYSVNDADLIVQVVKVGHRKDVYRAVP
jgi:mRNA interferase RelE/StbE